MTELLRKAFEEADRLPEKDQNALATRLLEEIESESRWSETLSRSGDTLARLANEALAEHRTGETQDLDPDRL